MSENPLGLKDCVCARPDVDAGHLPEGSWVRCRRCKGVTQI